MRHGIAYRVALAAILVTGCRAAGDPTASSSPPSPARSSATQSCSSAGNGSQGWPSDVPSALPVPAGLQVLESRKQGNVSIIRFTTSLSLSEAARLLVEDLPNAGFRLRGGDAEGDEIDQPFSGPGYLGAFKLYGVAPCRTDGTLVGTRQTG